jgi:hypothetical protein
MQPNRKSMLGLETPTTTGKSAAKTSEEKATPSDGQAIRRGNGKPQVGFSTDATSKTTRKPEAYSKKFCGKQSKKKGKLKQKNILFF